PSNCSPAFPEMAYRPEHAGQALQAARRDWFSALKNVVELQKPNGSAGLPKKGFEIAPRLVWRHCEPFCPRPGFQKRVGPAALTAGRVVIGTVSPNSSPNCAPQRLRSFRFQSPASRAAS